MQDRSYHESALFFARSIGVRREGRVRRATAASLGKELPFEQNGDIVHIQVPQLGLLELLVIE